MIYIYSHYSSLFAVIITPILRLVVNLTSLMVNQFPVNGT